MPLSYVDLERAERNVAQFSAFVTPGAGGPLREQYLHALNRLQSSHFDVGALAAGPLVRFGHTSDSARRAKALYDAGEGAGPRFTDPAYDERTARELAASYARGMALLDGYCADAAGLVRLLVAETIFTAIGPGKSGSCGLRSFLGVVWLYPGARWSDLRFAESMLHETVHHALFFEEMCRTLFAVPPDELRRTPMPTAINNVPKDFGTSFHSVCISAALVELFAAVGAREQAADYVRRAQPSLGAFAAARDVLSANGRRILDEAASALRAP